MFFWVHAITHKALSAIFSHPIAQSVNPFAAWRLDSSKPALTFMAALTEPLLLFIYYTLVGKV